jgi:hypothetical protein
VDTTVLAMAFLAGLYLGRREKVNPGLLETLLFKKLCGV